MHEELVSRRSFIKSNLAQLAAESQAFIDGFKDKASELPGVHFYQFSDNDCVLLCCPQSEQDHKIVRKTLEEASASFPEGFCDYGFLTKELYVYQKIADQKLLSRKKMQAYDALADDHAIESISVRRKKRGAPLVLVVEDDRFTASYISGFLKDFDLIVARTGEEAILNYIEYAPDAVFLDIHLPGINGHEALQAIKAADADAFVVMLSVDTGRTSIMNASINGAVSYLKKPFSRERVLNTLRLSPFIRESWGILPIQRGN
jgi:CheY-like chemotaxis protein